MNTRDGAALTMPHNSVAPDQVRARIDFTERDRRLRERMQTLSVPLTYVGTSLISNRATVEAYARTVRDE